MEMRLLLLVPRRAAAALVLAFPLLLLSACGGDDDPGERPTAYQPDAASSESSASAVETEQPSETPEAADDDETAQASEPSGDEQPREADSPAPTPSQRPSAAEPSDEGECVGADYTYTDLDHLTCEQAKVMVESILNTGGNRDDGTVADDENRCLPQDAGWWCQPDADGAEWPSTTITPNDPSYDPMGLVTRTWMPGGSRDAAADSSDTAAVECPGQRFMLTEVSNLSCDEALGMMDPFLSSGQQGGRISDVQCTVGSGEFQGETRERWSCARDSGGSLIAYRR